MKDNKPNKTDTSAVKIYVKKYGNIMSINH